MQRDYCEFWGMCLAEIGTHLSSFFLAPYAGILVSCGFPPCQKLLHELSLEDHQRDPIGSFDLPL